MVFLAAIVFVDSYHVPIYAITPGDAQSVSGIISVHGLSTDPHRDAILLTDVYISPDELTAGQWLLDQFQSHTAFVNANQLLDPNIPASEFNAQGFLQMSDSKNFARVAALRALGWKVLSRPVGTTLVGIVSNSPAWKAHLAVGDRVVSFNGSPVLNSCQFIVDLHHMSAGSAVTIGVQHATIGATGALTLQPTHNVHLTTVRANKHVGISLCANDVAPESAIGIAFPEDSVQYTIPGTIDISTPNIGGPSAGLAMTLALIDRLSSGSLTGHKTVAATGTIDPNGNVGDVGGVAQKTVAVERAGAKIFLVPQSELSTAQQASSGHLIVLGVSTLRQALRDLRHFGGVAPVPLSKPVTLMFTS